MAEITVKQLAVISENPDPVAFDLAGDVAALTPQMREAKVTTRPRIAAFLANVCVETDRFKTLEEYGDEAYFRSFLGDQWRYHGRGYLMNTWKAAYANLSKVLGVDLVAHPDRLANDKTLAARAATWFWTENNINRYADAGNFEAVCSIINRGQVKPTGPINGWDMRLMFHRRALEVLPSEATDEKKETTVPNDAPTKQDFWRFINWLRPAIGNRRTPYWVWEEGIIPDGPGAFAINRPVPSIEYVKGEPGIFCAGVTNLLLRFVGKKVPSKGDYSLDGGIAAYFHGKYGPGYFTGYDVAFDMATAKKWADATDCAVMIGSGYYGMALGSQGHVALLLPKHTDGKYYVPQSFGGYPKWPGLNWDFTIEESHAGGYYKRMVHPENFLLYRGDEF